MGKCFIHHHNSSIVGIGHNQVSKIGSHSYIFQIEFNYIQKINHTQTQTQTERAKIQKWTNKCIKYNATVQWRISRTFVPVQEEIPHLAIRVELVCIGRRGVKIEDITVQSKPHPPFLCFVYMAHIKRNRAKITTIAATIFDFWNPLPQQLFRI